MVASPLVSTASGLVFLGNSHKIFLEYFASSGGSLSEPEPGAKIKLRFNQQIIAKIAFFVNA
jgi:hypothetical protein